MKPRSKSVWMTAACGGVAHVDGPGAHFLDAGGEVGLQAQQLVAGADQAVEAGLFEAQVGQEGPRRPGRPVRLRSWRTGRRPGRLPWRRARAGGRGRGCSRSRLPSRCPRTWRA
jgi:hypothetical protein